MPGIVRPAPTFIPEAPPPDAWFDALTKAVIEAVIASIRVLARAAAVSSTAKAIFICLSAIESKDCPLTKT